MDIAKNWTLASQITQLCQVYELIDDPEYGGKEKAKEILESVINELIEDMDHK